MAEFARGAELVIADIEDKMNDLSSMAARYAAEAFAEGLREKLTGPRSGRLYRHPRGGQYYASEPGSITEQEYPAERMGKLRESIEAEIVNNGNGGTSWAVGSNLDYAGILMEGSDYMVARMFLYKHLLEERENLERIIGAPFYGDQPAGGRAQNPLNINAGRFGTSTRTAYNRRKEEIIALLEKANDTKAARASVSRAASAMSQNPDMKWHNVMRDIRSGKRTAQRYRWGKPI